MPAMGRVASGAAKAATMGFTAHIEFWILSVIFSTGFFFVCYWFFVRGLSNDGWKFWWIFVASFVTGWIGSLIARSVTGWWKMKYNVQVLLSMILTSLLYAAITFFSLYSILLTDLTWDRLLLTAIATKLCTAGISYGVSIWIASKARTKLENVIM